MSTFRNIWLHFGFNKSRKYKRLKRKLGGDGIAALIDLFLYAGEARPDGFLTELTDVDIVDETNWAGDPQELIKALKSSGWLTYIKERNCYYIDDFIENQPHLQPSAVKMRKERGKKAADTRWGGSKDEDDPGPETEPEPESTKPATKKKEYEVDFKMLPYPLILNGNMFDEATFLDMFYDCDKEIRAKIIDDVKRVRECATCKASFINNDLKKKICIACSTKKKKAVDSQKKKDLLRENMKELIDTVQYPIYLTKKIVVKGKKELITKYNSLENFTAKRKMYLDLTAKLKECNVCQEKFVHWSKHTVTCASCKETARKLSKNGGK
jgi:hypothetical protein